MMSLVDAAEKLADFERGGGRVKVKDPESGRFSTILHPDVASWREKLGDACAAAELAHRKGLSRNSKIYVFWSDVQSWVAKRWPYQVVRR